VLPAAGPLGRDPLPLPCASGLELIDRPQLAGIHAPNQTGSSSAASRTAWCFVSCCCCS